MPSGATWSPPRWRRPDCAFTCAPTAPRRTRWTSRWADTTGELRELAQLADLVFCGKSLPPHDGGQSPVEAASLGKPLLFGPHMTNFREIARALRECGAAREVLNESELVAASVELLADEAQRARMGAAALAWHAQNRGAVARTLAVIRELLAACG